MGAGLTSRIGAALRRPSDTMSWPQLAAATVAVLCVAVLWRQVTRHIMGEL